MIIIIWDVLDFTLKLDSTFKIKNRNIYILWSTILYCVRHTVTHRDVQKNGFNRIHMPSHYMDYNDNDLATHGDK